MSGTHAFVPFLGLAVGLCSAALGVCRDYALYKVSEICCLFSDYHPENGPIELGPGITDDLATPCAWSGVIRDNTHPDPAIGFAEGEFVLFVQGRDDMTSSGPWVDGIEARPGWTSTATARSTRGRSGRPCSEATSVSTVSPASST